MTDPLRIVFAGTPVFAAHHLQLLLDPSADMPAVHIVAVYTQPDRPAGRGKKATSSPVKRLAARHGIPVRQPVSLRDASTQAELAALRPDVMVVVAYGLILPQAVLDLPRLGCINVHASLLPRWRGAAPIQRAIEAGDHETGVTIMQMEAGLDTGPMLRIARCPIATDDTAATLHDKLATLGGPALLTTLGDLANGRARPQPQDEARSTYAAKIDKSEALLNWHEPATLLDRRIRAFNPAPVAYALLDDVRVKIHGARPVRGGGGLPGTIMAIDTDGVAVGTNDLLVACGEGSLAIQQLQLPGGKPLPVAAVLNGHAALFQPGRRFAIDDSAPKHGPKVTTSDTGQAVAAGTDNGGSTR